MLKRFVSFTLLGAMILLLSTGCNTENPGVETTLPTEVTTEPTLATVPPTTTPPPTTLPPETTAPPAPKEFPMGTTGTRTGGALRSLTLDMKIHCETYLFGENVLLCQPVEGRYQIVSLKDGSVLEKNYKASPANSVTVTDDQIIYYSLTAQKIFFLDRNLDVVKSVAVSASADVSDMVFSQDGTKAYYTDYHSIVELNIETGEERVIPVYGPSIWALSGLYFDDTILRYWGKEDGNDYYAFVNVETGAYLGKDNNMTGLQVWDNNYYLCRAYYPGTVERLVVLDGAYKYMIPKDHGKTSCYSTVLPQLNSFFTLSYDYDKTVVVLDLYDLATKQRTASLTVDLRGEFGSSAKVFVDPSGEYIWMSMKVRNQYNSYDMILYRWDYRANAIEDTTIYGYGG